MLIKTKNWGDVMEKSKHLGLKLDADTHKELKKLAELNGLSISGEIKYLIHKAIREYKVKYGQLE